MYEDKSPDPNIASTSEASTIMTTNLKDSLQTPGPHKLSAAHTELSEIGDKILKVAGAVKEQLQKCQPRPRARKPMVIFKALSYNLKHKSRIEKLSIDLSGLQNVMETRILITIRETLMKDRELNTNRFQNLEDRLQCFHSHLLAGHTRLEEIIDPKSGELKSIVHEEAQKTRHHVTRVVEETQEVVNARLQETNGNISTQFQIMQEERVSEDVYKQLENSFRYPGINARRNTIQKAQDQTFEWIFQELYETTKNETWIPKWDSFPDWLRSDKGIYWISGEAGAGKSTLIKFLEENDKIRQLLSESRPNTLIIAAYIWNAGAPMQRSFFGLLCSLPYDLFTSDSDICHHILRSQKETFRLKRETLDWTTEELKELLLKALQALLGPFVCLSMDWTKSTAQHH
jgi:hypothetical protein